MMIRSISRLVLLLLVISLIANAVPAQVTTSGRLSGVVKDDDGNLYGTTDLGGASGLGTVYVVKK